ncbi:MAG TPA: PAS domain S-box protein [Actinopolymorphaceae bacterium]|jgi:PAS domain S-box-containing protein
MTEPSTRVVIADDDREMRDALADLIASQPGLELAGEAVSHDDAIRLAARDHPRVLVLDARMPDGETAATIRSIQDRSPNTAVLVLSAYEDPGNAVELLSAGATGYLVKGAADSEILEAIARAARGQVSISLPLAKECLAVLRRNLETERRASAATLQSANVLRQLLDRIRAAAILLGANGAIEMINAPVLHMFGYPRTDLIGEPITKLVPVSRLGEPVDELIYRLLSREPPGELGPEAQFTGTGRRRDGSTFPVQVSASLMPHGQRGVAVVLRDISDINRAETRYQALFEALPDALVVVDGNGRITLVNAAAERLFGYPREELLERTVDTLLPEHPVTLYRTEEPGSPDAPHAAPDANPRDSGPNPRRPSAAGSKRENEMNGKSAVEPDKSIELIGRKRDGTDFPVAVTVGRMLTDEGPRTVLSMRDMTEAASSRQALEHSIEMLRAAGVEHRNVLVDLVGAHERERQRIAAGIHDDSLQVITAAALRMQQLRRRLRDPDDLKVLAKVEETIRLAADRLRRMIFDFRPPALEHEGLVAALKVYLEQLHNETKISYELDNRLESEPPMQTRVLIYRIAQDALMNVRLHSRASNVTVRLSEVDTGILTEIIDNGVGYNPMEAEAEPGHLGLTLMRDRAEIVGGWCRIESAPGAGTTVEFWVPREVGMTGTG